MTETELATALAPMVTLIGKPMTREQIQAWHLMLDDLDVATVRRGVISTMRDYQYAGFPPVGVVRKNCGATIGNITSQDRATIAWATVKAAVATHGGFATVAFDDPITTATIKALGGWVRVCDTEAGEAFDVWLKKDFEKTYSALMVAGVNAEQTQPLAGLCDIANGAGGHDERESVRVVSTGLPNVPKHLVRGEQKRPALVATPAVKRLAATLGVDQITLAPVAVTREPSLSAADQKRQLAAWQAARSSVVSVE